MFLILLDTTQFAGAQKYLGWHCPWIPIHGYVPAFYTTKYAPKYGNSHKNALLWQQ